MSFLKEMFSFFQARKKMWLLPVVVVMLVFGALFVLAESAVIAPFIYTLF